VKHEYRYAHTAEKPLKYTGKKYNACVKRRNAIKKPLMCNYCGTTYKREAFLRKHEATHVSVGCNEDLGLKSQIDKDPVQNNSSMLHVDPNVSGTDEDEEYCLFSGLVYNALGYTRRELVSLQYYRRVSQGYHCT
jgi:hypothetical protein